VADHAAVIFNNGVKLPLFGRIVVTLQTERRPFLYKDQLLFVTMIIMARRTIILIQR
jgi:hypothetical protein